jgi:hypothetical protein
MNGSPEPLAPGATSLPPPAPLVDPGPPGSTPAPGIPPPPPPPNSRKNLYIAIGAVVVVVVVVIALLAVLGVFNSSSPASGPMGSPLPYSQAIGPAQTSANTTQGGPWTIVAAEGIGIANGISSTNSEGVVGGSCTFTPVADSPSEVTIPGTPGNATGGSVAFWIFFATQTNSSAILLLSVTANAILPWGTITGSECSHAFGDLGGISNQRLIDSTTAAADLDSNGGTAFLSNHTGVSQEFILFGAEEATSNVAAWDVTYTTCGLTATSGSGYEITAAFLATTGAIFEGPTSEAITCGSS